MEKEQKESLIRIIASAVLLGAAYLVNSLTELTAFQQVLLFLIPYLAAGYDVIISAVKNILHGELFDEMFLMTVATVGAFCIGDYPEGVFVMIFYQLGEFFQDYAVDKSRDSISALMEICPETANLETENGLKTVDPKALKIGDIIVVKAGEKVPVNGRIIEGTSSLDTSALTGESLPREVGKHDEVLGGCININGTLRIKVTSVFADSAVAKILEMVEHASEKKGKAEKFITKFSKIYTPAVVVAAVMLAVIPPLVTGQPFASWVNRALIFLVISCPCALVISVPLSFFSGIGGASKRGILIKGSTCLEALSKTSAVVFDKTGTLTEGKFSVTAVHPQVISEEELVKIAASAEYFTEAKMAKDNSRSKALEILNQTATNESFEGDVRKQAQNKIVSIAENTEKETIIENVAKAKGYKDISVYIDGESVEIIVKKNNFSSEDVKTIKEIVTSELDTSAKNIKIIEAK